MELNVGDYVRTKNGIIGKIQSKNYIGYSDWIIDNLYYNFDEIIDDWTCGIKEYDVIKSSSNIIDLIEVGDYVNGKKVTKINLDRNIDKRKRILCEDLHFDYLDEMYINEDIKSIVTKEQFESMEYKIGE